VRRACFALAICAALSTAACTSPASPADAGADAGHDAGVDAGDAGADAGDGGDDAGPSFTQAELAALATLAPEMLPPPPADISNRFADNPAAAALGQKLFFETAFSGKLLDGDNDGSANTLGSKGQAGRVSCAGCHIAAAGFLDNRTLGKQITLAAGWNLRRTIPLLDVGQARLLMWDGRRDALYNQPLGPLESAVEMNSSRLYVAEQLYALHKSDYEVVFGAMPALQDTARFPPLSAALTGCQPSTVDPPPAATCNGTIHGMPGDRAEFDGMAPADQTAVNQVVVNLGKALGAYERKLSCGPSRFDAWVHGATAALTPAEQRGAQIFVGRGKCIQCHSGPYLSDEQFHNVGLQPTQVAVTFLDANDPGASQGLAQALADPFNTRGAFSDGDDGRLQAQVPAGMTGAFRTPGLRCVARRPSFMHTGQLASLAQVVSFFSRGGDVFGYPGTKEIAALSLSADDQANLTAFLGALEGPGPATNLLTP
jgi:cytochrome c peroxidase